MAPSIFTTKYNVSGFARNARYNYQLWSVTVQDFEGEELEYEVSAENANEAADKAISLAAEDGMYSVSNTIVSKF